MKCLLVVTIAALAFAAADEEWKPPTNMANQREIHELCVKESGVTKEQEAKIRNFERPDEKEVRDLILCNVKKLEIFTDDRGFIPERLMLAFTGLNVDKDKAQEIVNKCVDSNEQKSEPAVWAYRGVECMMNNKIDQLLREAQDRMREQNKSNEV